MNRELKSVILEDKAYYYGNGKKRLYRMLTHNPVYQRGRYVILCRKAGYYATHQSGLTGKLLLFLYTLQKNRLGEKLNIEFGPSEFGRRLKIYHGNIVVNYATKIGDDVELYGSNCIGNKGSFTENTAPTLGNRVSVGVGSNIVGDVHVADGIRISGMSWVNKDLPIENSLYGGVPAKWIKTAKD